MKKLFIAVSLMACVALMFSCKDKNSSTCTTCGWGSTQNDPNSMVAGTEVEKCGADIDTWKAQSPKTPASTGSVTVKTVTQYAVCK